MTCLWVGAAFRAAGGFARVEAGNVFADEGVARDKSDEDSTGVAGAAFGTLDCRGELPSGGIGEGEVDSGTPVGVVPASLPGREGEFLRCRSLEGNRVGFAEVWLQGIGCAVERKLDAPFDAYRLGLSLRGAPVEVDFRVPEDRENLSQR